MHISRRTFLQASAAASGATAFAQARQATERRATEWSFTSGKRYPNPSDIELNVEFTGPQGARYNVPAFWAGDDVWRVRFAAPDAGSYQCRSVCSDAANRDLHGVTSTLQVRPYEGANPLYKRGAPRVSSDKRYLEHSDGTPFFWLADTWWMGLVERMRWPEDFQYLTADRKRKGFSVVQIVAGIYPDMDSFDPRGRGDGGFPWTDGYGAINPAWWDMADLRIQYLAESGIVPCIVGCWGYYLQKLGPEKIRKHWRTIVARWGAYPVVWTLAGEGSMPWYLSERKDQDREELVKGWTEIARYVRGIDPYHRLVTVHPSRSAKASVSDPGVLDFDMLQTGHSDRRSLANTVRSVTASYQSEPRMPVINGEVCYEGILSQSKDEVQRLMFWACMLSGACGHTYGANGIWQVNEPGKPYGASPSGNTWGNTPWKDAAHLPGSGQLGHSAALLRQMEWWKFTPHPEWVEPHWSEQNYEQSYAAGIPGRLRVVYIPSMAPVPTLVSLESGAWNAAFLNPGTGERHEIGRIEPADGKWRVPKYPEMRDWVVVLESKG